MKLNLYERRIGTKLIPNTEVIRTVEKESTCAHCRERNSTEPTGMLVPNTQGLCDEKGSPMLDQPVMCLKCNKKWVDVFCRVYEPDTKGDESGNGIGEVL